VAWGFLQSHLTQTVSWLTLELIDKVAEELGGIRKAFEKQNEMMLCMLNFMDKPKSKFYSAIEVVVLIVGALGILHTADVIRRWLTGVDMLFQLIVSVSITILAFTAYFMLRRMRKNQ